MSAENNIPEYSKKDFVSDQEVRWCPGCGDYAILAAIQNVMPQIGKKKEDIVFVSGIGCSSRFPYYMNTFGMHTIHGRAAAISSGVKCANPDLSVWVMTGDGDSLAIGGNHYIHTLRRNLDLNIVLFNNEIYGLTKGQYSPTSQPGAMTKTSPYGSIERPFSAASLSIGAQGTFFARTVYTDLKHMQACFKAAAEHKGTAVVEVLQNCVIFNDGCFQQFVSPAEREDNLIRIEHGKPMIFGKNNEFGIVLDGIRPKVVKIGEDGITEKDLLVHDSKAKESTLAFFLSQMTRPEFPLPIGIFRDVDSAVYDEELIKQMNQVTEQKGVGSMDALLSSGDTWTIEAE